MEHLLESAPICEKACRAFRACIAAPVPELSIEDYVFEDEDSEMDVDAQSDHGHTDFAAISERDWADLLPEALADIFGRLPFDERLLVLPLVCKSWNQACRNPGCWLVVDMEPWLRTKTQEDSWWEYNYDNQFKMSHVIREVANRSCGQIRQLRTISLTPTAADSILKWCPTVMLTSWKNPSADGREFPLIDWIM